MKKYRLFIRDVAWSNTVFLVDVNLDYKYYKTHKYLKFLSKNNFKGIFEFDKEYLNNVYNIEKVKDCNIYYNNLF